MPAAIGRAAFRIGRHGGPLSPRLADPCLDAAARRLCRATLRVDRVRLCRRAGTGVNRILAAGLGWRPVARCHPTRIGVRRRPPQRLMAHATAVSRDGNRRFIEPHGGLDPLIRGPGSAEEA